MTTMTPDFETALRGLPDPASQPGFYAGVPVKRAIAWVFDSAIIFLLAILASVLTFGLGFLVFFGLWAVISFLYRIATLTTRSSTWGMRLMSIELRDGMGQRFSGMTALLHTVGLMISFATGLQIVSAIMMLITDRGQGLTDVILSTTAVNQIARA